PPPPPALKRPLHLRVLGPGGEPVADAGVYCNGENSGWAYTGPDGTGACQLLADGPLPIDCRVRIGGAVAAGKPTDWTSELVLQLKAGMTIRGRVIGDAGADAFINQSSSVEMTGFPVQPSFVLEDQPFVRTILC